MQTQDAPQPAVASGGSIVAILEHALDELAAEPPDTALSLAVLAIYRGAKHQSSGPCGTVSRPEGAYLRALDFVCTINGFPLDKDLRATLYGGLWKLRLQNNLSDREATLTALHTALGVAQHQAEETT